jgi:glutaredoxin
MNNTFIFLFCLLVNATSAFVLQQQQRSGRRSSRNAPPLARLYMSVPTPLDTLTSGLASISRLPHGVECEANAIKGSSVRLKTLYDVESNNACRLVRERITELDLCVEQVVPSAKNSRISSTDRTTEEIPRLVVVEQDDSNERVLTGAPEIVSYLNSAFSTEKSGDTNEDPDIQKQIIDTLSTIGGYVALLLRLGRGSAVASAALDNPNQKVPRPKQPLVLYSYEGNQFCRLVREVLCELDLPYELRSAGKQSPRRAELAEITGGSSQCPFLIDPNRNVQMAESADIIKYLYANYAFWTPPNELLRFASDSVLPLVKPLFQLLAPLQAGSFRDDGEYERSLKDAKRTVKEEISQAPVVIYTYKLSPFSTETKALLENLKIDYSENSLGLEWIPGLIAEGGSMKRAALLEMTGQSSLPQVFIGGKAIGGLFSGTPGLVPALEKGTLMEMVQEALQTEPSSSDPVASKE